MTTETLPAQAAPAPAIPALPARRGSRSFIQGMLLLVALLAADIWLM